MRQFLHSTGHIVAYLTLTIAATISCDVYAAETVHEKKVIPGSLTVLDTFACAKIDSDNPPKNGKVDVLKNTENGTSSIIFTSDQDQREDVTVSVFTGTISEQEPRSPNCGATKPSKYAISFIHTPKISDKILNSAFKILFFSFVLAILLESAFALIFNWRVFQLLLVGKAWRTPIMFIGSLMVVTSFHFDLVALLQNVYDPSGNVKELEGDWFTSALTAMILAGGSSGVNKIMVALGLRTDVRPEVEKQHTNDNDTKAWVSIRVTRNEKQVKAIVNITELESCPGHDDIPMTVGLIGTRKVKLRDILFPSNTRFPPSGGREVTPKKCYRITLIENGNTYDINGSKIHESMGQLIRFGPRSIVDLEVDLKN